MQARINLITIWTNNPGPMFRFYRDVLGFRPLGEVDESDIGYVEFAHEGVRFSLCTRAVMVHTTGIAAFSEPPRGQVVELAFPCDSPADVDRVYAEIISQGASPVYPPADMPWNQRTALFADPDGNIHELFANLT